MRSMSKETILLWVAWSTIGAAPWKSQFFWTIIDTGQAKPASAISWRLLRAMSPGAEPVDNSGRQGDAMVGEAAAAVEGHAADLDLALTADRVGERLVPRPPPRVAPITSVVVSSAPAQSEQTESSASALDFFCRCAASVPARPSRNSSPILRWPRYASRDGR